MWAPAWDDRIRASVSNCGCITYRESFTHDAGVQAEFVVPGFAVDHDLEDVVAAAEQCAHLVIAAQADTRSRGARDLAERLDAAGATHARNSRRLGRPRLPAAPPRRGLRVPRKRTRTGTAFPEAQIAALR